MLYFEEPVTLGHDGWILEYYRMSDIFFKLPSVVT